MSVSFLSKTIVVFFFFCDNNSFQRIEYRKSINVLYYVRIQIYENNSVFGLYVSLISVHYAKKSIFNLWRYHCGAETSEYTYIHYVSRIQLIESKNNFQMFPPFRITMWIMWSLLCLYDSIDYNVSSIKMYLFIYLFFLFVFMCFYLTVYKLKKNKY